MTTILYVSIGAALSQMILVALLLSAGNLDSLSRKLYALLIFAVICYLVMPLTDGGNLHMALGAFSTLVPGAFWLFSASLFDDHYHFGIWQWVLVALTVLMPTSWGLFFSSYPSWVAILLVEVPQILEFAFLGMAAYIIFRSWKDDLVSARRTLRIWFCAILGLVILMVLLAREILFPGADWLGPAQYLVTAIAATGTNIILLRFESDLLNPVRQDHPAVVSEDEPSDPTDIQAQLEPVIQMIEKGGLHREWGMTIGKLAAAADIPEYRLRQLINSGLGYRNFNDFLNRFRIQEASERLADADQVRVPILTIALEAGFRSISTFNKAFKDINQMTPTAFRKEMNKNNQPTH